MMAIWYHRQLFSNNWFILFDYHLSIRSSVRKLIQYLLLLSSLPLLMRINAWSVRIHFLACWQLRVVKLKTIFRNFKNSWNLYKALLLLVIFFIFTRIPCHNMYLFEHTRRSGSQGRIMWSDILLFYSIYWS